MDHISNNSRYWIRISLHSSVTLPVTRDTSRNHRSAKKTYFICRKMQYVVIWMGLTLIRRPTYRLTTFWNHTWGFGNWNLFNSFWNLDEAEKAKYENRSAPLCHLSPNAEKPYPTVFNPFLYLPLTLSPYLLVWNDMEIFSLTDHLLIPP